MSNMLKAGGILAATICVVAVLALLVFDKDPTDRSSPSNFKDNKLAKFVEDMPNPLLKASDKMTGNKAEPPKWREGAISGEQVLFFKDAVSYKTFIEQASALGITVLDTLDAFRSVRVRASYDELASLNGNFLIDANYRVEVPGVPQPEIWSQFGMQSFENNALSFLGIDDPSSIKDWGKGVMIAVLDTGWAGHSSVNKDIRQIDLTDGLQDAGQQLSGHGTAVIGLLASDDGIVQGIAQGSEILSIKVLDGTGQGDVFTLSQGIVQAVDSGAQVITLSLGAKADSTILKQAVEYAFNRGVVLVASPGNDGQLGVRYPAAYDEVIGVTSIDASGDRADYANFGEGVDLAAPGRNLYSLWTGDEIVYFDGTSASAALAAGVVARQIQNGNVTDSLDAESFLMGLADDAGPPGSDIFYGAGIIDMDRLEGHGVESVIDLALADLYPALEESNSGEFPLYVTVQNQGTEYVSGAKLSLNINGQPFFYDFAGFNAGETKSVQIPVSEAYLSAGNTWELEASAEIQEAPSSDERPDNNEKRIRLEIPPGG